jgi:DNA-binding NarL/FixJ family response regulator
MVRGDLAAALDAVAVLEHVQDPIRYGSALVEVARLALEQNEPAAAAQTAARAVEVLDPLGAVEAEVARAVMAAGASTRPARAPRPRRPTSGWESLTPTELLVVEAVSEGLSNPQIAARLYVSRHTVESHVKHIFVKLGITSRVELAGMAVRRSVAPSP